MHKMSLFSDNFRRSFEVAKLKNVEKDKSENSTKKFETVFSKSLSFAKTASSFSMIRLKKLKYRA